MASLYDTSATKALNEGAYINKLYDGTMDSQKKALQQGYDNSIKQLTTGQNATKQQTSDYVKRTYVEAEKAAGAAKAAGSYTPGLSGSAARAQAGLTLGNQKQANTTALNNQQAAADIEYERQRKLLADRYSAQIQQAQANNDMARAQALYAAAKAEEEQLRALRESAASLMAGKGDMSITEAIARGDTVTPDTSSQTWEGVTKNEDSINKIYDAQMESQRQQAQMEHDESISKLEAQQQAAQRQTDENLNQAYVDALKKNKNYQEVQSAYGQGSGTAARARLARETGLTERLTDLRKLQLNKDAQTEQQKAELTRALGETISKAQETTDAKRNQALYDAAEDEEQALIADQKTVGDILAKQNNYSVLGALYGLTPDQIHRLQGTGAYAPVYYGGGGGDGGGGYRHTGGGGDDTGGGGTFVGANPSIIGLGQGPISSQNLQSQIASGKVIATPNSSGGITYSNAPTNTAGITMQLANAGKPVYTAISSKSGGGTLNKIATAISKIPVVGTIGTAIGNAIGNAYVKASSKK